MCTNPPCPCCERRLGYSPDNCESDIGLDYRKLFNEQTELVAEGKGKEAVVLLASHAFPDTFPAEARDSLQKKFAILYGAGGKYVGQDLAGSKPIGSRAIWFYVTTYFEKKIVVFSYLFIRTMN